MLNYKQKKDFTALNSPFLSGIKPEASNHAWSDAWI